MSKEEQYYNKEYYDKYLGSMPYAHGYGWEEIFGRYAARIKNEIAPKRTLDVGCAIGFMVEALHDIGVEAYGIDISEYAISQVREDIKPFCRVKDATLDIEEKYDLITCIEVVEHLDMKDAVKTIEQMCKAADDIIFSSTPFDYNEESHISVNSPEYWAQIFAYNGFYHDVDYDCSYIAVQAMRFRKRKLSEVELIRAYERKLFMLVQENFAVRNRMQYHSENAEIYKDAYNKHVVMINEELNPKIAELEKRCAELQQKNEAANEEIERVRKDVEEQKNNLRISAEEKQVAFEESMKNERLLLEGKYKELEQERASLCEAIEKDRREIIDEKAQLAVEKSLIEDDKRKLESEMNRMEAEYQELRKQLEIQIEERISEQLIEKSRELEKEFVYRLDAAKDDLSEEKEKYISQLDSEYKDKLYSIKQCIKNNYYNQLKEAISEGKRKEELYYAALNLLNVRTAEYEQAYVPTDIRDRGEIEGLISIYLSSLMGGGLRKIVGEYRKEKKRTDALLRKEKGFWDPVFDLDYYIENNPDVSEYYNGDKEAIFKHFVRYGMFEGRKSKASFDVFAYAHLNSDIKEKFGAYIREYYVHYIEYGLGENRKCFN
ncbi:MAG: methyltransferase domain-containing protein [Lachnospiraceae bacterium]|nr:methyltransferase domain-containing protein [Lachnospiraceae bacterium]